ncbi:MAG: hypothetical protein SFY69_05230 [Planctomycetota bacterium]|nr:hypothetical protein [Planctomycetota bacterium]
MALAQRYTSLPRSARWLIMLVVGVGVYFGVVEPGLDVFNGFVGRGDAAEAVLERYMGASDTIKRAGETALLGVRQYGEVEYPGDPESRPPALNKAIDEILRKHGVTGQTSTTRTTPLGRGPLVTRAGATHKIDRLTKVLEFQADPDVVALVLADLEQNPLVTTISNVQIRQGEGRDRSAKVVSASITVESWLLARKERTR